MQTWWAVHVHAILPSRSTAYSLRAGYNKNGGPAAAAPPLPLSQPPPMQLPRPLRLMPAGGALQAGGCSVQSRLQGTNSPTAAKFRRARRRHHNRQIHPCGRRIWTHVCVHCHTWPTHVRPQGGRHRHVLGCVGVAHLVGCPFSAHAIPSCPTLEPLLARRKKRRRATRGQHLGHSEIAPCGRQWRTHVCIHCCRVISHLWPKG